MGKIAVSVLLTMFWKSTTPLMPHTLEQNSLSEQAEMRQH